MYQHRIHLQYHPGLQHYHGICSSSRHFHQESYHGMFSSDMALWSVLRPGHIRTYARNGNTKGEGSYAPYHHCTSQPAASISMPLCWQVPHHLLGQYNAGSTTKNQPTEALYLSHALLFRHSMDKLSQPRNGFWKLEIPRYPLVHSCLPPADEAEVLLQESVHNHIFHILQSESAHPSNAVWKIPSHAV